MMHCWKSKAHLLAATILAAVVSGCSSSAKFVAVPHDLDKANVPRQSISMTAKRFHFEPEKIHVKAGTLLTVKIKSVQGTHGFRLSEFDIDETLEENEEKTVELYLSTPGEFSFRCSHFCGLGHLGMTGKIVVK
jgi:cytochrome c oxidase subunit 2